LPEDNGWRLPQKVQDTRRLKKVDRIRASEEEVKANLAHVVLGFELQNA
jgi:16S rRNA (cytosine1402-N4)-methyltransferase